MKKLIPLSLAAATLAFGAAYKIPEQSLNSTALAGAYVSHTTAADAAYFNPANMAFLPDGRSLELNLMYIHLTPIKNDTSGNETKRENFVLPQLHVVSDRLGSEGNWRIGFSVTEPGGLAKRWDDTPEAYQAKKFELRVFELAPSLSYRFSEKFAIGLGVRYIYTDGKIETKEFPAGVHPDYPDGIPARKMEGDGNRFGYNLAISYKALPEWGLAATYRSKVDLKEEGNTKFYGAGFTGSPLEGKAFAAEVTVPLPATLSLATDYTFNSGKTTVELEYERVYWSEYENLDFNYDYAALESSPLGQPIPKNWDDTNTFRIGLTHHYSKEMTWMFGYAHDESPVPEETLGYELPDSDANIFSLGFRYKINDDMEIGMAYLLDKKDDRSVTNTSVGHAEFTNTYAHLVSFGLGYRY